MRRERKKEIKIKKSKEVKFAEHANKSSAGYPNSVEGERWSKC